MEPQKQKQDLVGVPRHVFESNSKNAGTGRDTMRFWKRTPLSVAVDMVGAGGNLFSHAPGVSKHKEHHQKKTFSR
jgi:hypothetical protein